MKKILFTSNVSWAMIKFRYNLLQYLIAQGYQVFIVAPHDEFVDELEKLGCHCINIKLSRKGVNPVADMLLTYNLYKIYKKVNPDIIFNYSIKPIIYGSIAAKLAKIDSIAVNIGLGYTFINTNLVTKISHILYKLALLFPKYVWFINEDDKNEFVKRSFVQEERTLVLPSEGIDTNYFYPREKHTSEVVFLLIARMLWDKGVGEFYEAAKMLKKTFPSVRFQLLGSVDLENPRGISFEQLEAWGKEGYVEYLGYSKDVREYIAQSSCVVLPSYREGKGMTLIEAGSMGKPLIATNVEGCKDIVRDGYNGFLCEARNSTSLANSMKRFIDLDAKSKEAMSMNARNFMIDNFDVENVIRIYGDTIENH